MKKSAFLFVTYIAIAFYFFSCSSTNNDSISLDEKSKAALLTSINKFNTAFQKGDVTTLANMITSDYIHTNSSSKAIRKENWLNYLHKRAAQIQSGDIQVLSYKMDEIKTIFHGNSAIVTGKVTVITKKDNTLTENSYRVTNIWIYESGNWKRAAFHDGKIK
ncbi:nuclear transport factor 2 family protein [Tenacibaculum amylolyticum]|uniref:nuclear transport factor 2 family protein n=1 Tax=Tenacibaculum amylolyticum TaxID=104269 RepID=UPI0038B5EB3D